MKAEGRKDKGKAFKMLNLYFIFHPFGVRMVRYSFANRVR
jgi:hypothetical protein